MPDSSDPQKPPKRAGPILRRLLGYVFRYKIRVFVGIFLALVVSLSNLFSLSAFVPIFNTMGQEGEAAIFELSYKDYLHQACYAIRTKGGIEDSVLDYVQKLDVLVAAKDLGLAKKDRKNWQELCAYYHGNLYQDGLIAISRFKFWVNGHLKGKDSGEVILLICMVLLPVYFLKILCLIGTIYCIGTAGYMAVRDLRMELYKKMNKLSFDYFQKERTGIIMSRISNDAEIVGKTLSTDFTDALVNIFYIATHIPALVIINWEMLLITLVVGPLLVAPVSNFAVKIRKAYTNQQQRLAELAGHIQEVISGIRVIRAFGMESFEEKKFSKINKRLYEHTFRGHYFHQVGPALTDLVAGVVMIGFLAYGAYAISNANFDKGRFMAFFFLLLFVMRPIKQISVMTNLLSAATAAAARIFEICDAEDGIREKADALPFPKFKEKITYKNVHFQYEGSEAEALRGVSFEVAAGRSLALVGASGAGKTTLLDLLPRFYDVTAGSIELDGIDIRDMRIDDLRAQISLVGQDVFLFHTSIRENIAYGRSDIPLEKIIEAAKVANAHDFISNLPEGYDTEIGERGVMLSGGQRQRIAIARAILLDAPILILDEATSNLDNESENLVQSALEKLMQGRTVLVIAHRLSTIFRSDEILVMDQGRIAERGRHEELLKKGGLYKKLYDMQFSGS